MKTVTHSLYLILVSIWTGWTVLTDFYVVPTVFRMITSFFEAGDLGIALFSKLNSLELVLSTILVAILAIDLVKKKSLKLPFIAAILAWIIVMIYVTFLTQKITDLTVLWQKAESLGALGIAGVADVQQEHQKFHKIYVSLDSVKLVILLFLLSWGVIKADKWT